AMAIMFYGERWNQTDIIEEEPSLS
ncbi:hypothetical protein LCGC14_2088950, partial [marine sediment metagenome]